MSTPQIYTGSCHCGQVRYQVTTALDNPVLSCNCSICRRKGSLLQFVPAEAFRLLAGEEALGDYQFNTHNIHHLFCRTCGIASFSRGAMPDGTPMVAINVRCLEDVDPDALTITKFDGKAL